MSAADWLWLASWAIWSAHYIRTEKRLEHEHKRRLDDLREATRLHMLMIDHARTLDRTATYLPPDTTLLPVRKFELRILDRHYTLRMMHREPAE